MLGRCGAPMRKLLVIICLVSIASCGNVQGAETDTGTTQSNTEPGYDLPAAIAACEEMLHGPSRCEAHYEFVREVWDKGAIYSQYHPDVIHACAGEVVFCSGMSLQQKIQEMCSQCKDCYSLESPQTRLESAVKAGDFIFLGVRRGDLESLFVPCLPDGFPEPANVISMSAVFGLSHSKIAEEYAAEYNLLLLKYLLENPD